VAGGSASNHRGMGPPSRGRAALAASDANYLDELEARIVEIYDAGADVPVAIELIDEVVAIIRWKSEPHEVRVREIGQLMQKRGAQIARPARG
jgi:hypothetical protein